MNVRDDAKHKLFNVSEKPLGFINIKESNGLHHPVKAENMHFNSKLRFWLLMENVWR